MDGAALLSVQIAQDKAFTAAGFGMPTDGWHDFIKDDPPLASGAVGGIDRLVVFGGGYPIKLGDALVGAIGVSGGHYSQDMEVAQAGPCSGRLSRSPADRGGSPQRTQPADAAIRASCNRSASQAPSLSA